MELLLDILIDVSIEAWNVLQESAPYVLLGFFMAGLLKAYLPGDFVNKHLGGNSISGVMKAAVLGAPIPLCSCGVVPAVAGIRKMGAGKGPAAAFLVATPETGVDSIAVTYALLDPLMTVIRPVFAVITAIFTGIFVNLTDKDDRDSTGDPVDSACTCTDLGCASCESDGCASCESPGKIGLLSRFSDGMRYAFQDLLSDIGLWFVAGVIVAGAIEAFLPAEFIGEYLGEGLLPMVLMLAVAAPVYVCATASTPIAAALALKGLSPGAALVFLLAGPATNAASLIVVSKILGKRATAVYLASIIACSILLGLAANYLYAYFGLSVSDWVRGRTEEGHGILAFSASILLIVLIVRAYLKSRKAGEETACGCESVSHTH